MSDFHRVIVARIGNDIEYVVGYVQRKSGVLSFCRNGLDFRRVESSFERGLHVIRLPGEMTIFEFQQVRKNWKFMHYGAACPVILGAETLTLVFETCSGDGTPTLHAASP